MSKEEMIKSIQSLLEDAELRELELIYRIVKNMILK